MTEPLYLWLEAGRPDTEEGLRARVADPVWFLTRQWQLGEHQGEDASSPVVVTVSSVHRPIGYDPGRGLDPTVVPAEALLEAEPGDWWTIGRRVRLGRAAAPLLDAADRTAFAFGELPRPYGDLAGEVDGRAVFASGQLAGNAIWSEVPSPSTDRWSPTELHHSAPFEAEGTALRAEEHQGGDVDWFTVDAATGGTGVRKAVTEPQIRQVIPTTLDYPGAPLPRWWELEDREVDFGGFAPDRSHFPTMMLLDVVLAHADDWFVFGVPQPHPPSRDDSPLPSSGVLVSLPEVTVRDSFDETWTLTPPPESAWSLFHTRGLAAGDLVVWPVAVAPLTGPLLDDVLIGVDEDANLAWAVELRADGHPLLDNAETAAAIAETTRTGTRAFRYLPSTTLPDHWHPYQRVRKGDLPTDPPGLSPDGRGGPWRQAVLADLTGPHPEPRPGPVSRLIGGPSGSGLGRGHELAATAIPSNGVRLQRRARLARDTEGRPVLWVERSARPVTGPPTSHLRFDVLAEDPAAEEGNP